MQGIIIIIILSNELHFWGLNMLKLLHALLHEILLWWKIGSQAPPKLQPLS